MAGLEGLLVVITGGGSGIGQGIAQVLASRSARVCITGRSRERLARARQELLSDHPGAEVTVRAFDVTRREAVSGAIDAIERELGPIHGLVNSAGIYQAAKFMDYRSEDFERMFRVNVSGVVHTMQAALRHMIPRGQGKIVNIASTAGKWGSMNQSAYNASKHALVGLTRCTALEFAGAGIAINALCPGIVDTQMGRELLRFNAAVSGVDVDSARQRVLERIPMRRIPQPEEIGELAACLLSPALAGMTGQSILYDGGMLMV